MDPRLVSDRHCFCLHCFSFCFFVLYHAVIYHRKRKNQSAAKIFLSAAHFLLVQDLFFHLLFQHIQEHLTGIRLSGCGFCCDLFPFIHAEHHPEMSSGSIGEIIPDRRISGDFFCRNTERQKDPFRHHLIAFGVHVDTIDGELIAACGLLRNGLLHPVVEVGEQIIAFFRELTEAS